jgi:hypothetical protein
MKDRLRVLIYSVSIHGKCFHTNAPRTYALTTIPLKCNVFWDTTPCSVVEIYLHYGLLPHFQILIKYSDPKHP